VKAVPVAALGLLLLGTVVSAFVLDLLKVWLTDAVTRWGRRSDADRSDRRSALPSIQQP